MSLECPGNRGDTGGKQPPPPTVPPLQHAGVMAGSEGYALAHHVIQEGGVSKETASDSGGEEGGHIQGLQRLWTPTGDGYITDLFTWVDSSYSVHPNMRFQTGRVTSMVYRMLHCQSSKKNLNAKSLIGAELIGTSEYVLFNVLMVMFLES